jgi:hypothetical protein
MFPKAHFRSIEMGSHLQVREFYSHLPSNISKEDDKLVGQYIVDQFGEAEGFQFYFRQKYTLSKQARGYSSIYSNAVVIQYDCSQRQRVAKPSSLPYARTRNRRARIHLFNCTGSISVICFSKNSTPDFDIAIDFNHEPHPGREFYGVPVKVRQWIKSNPYPTPGAQRTALFNAMKKKEIEGVKEQYLSAPLIHYWWRKMHKEKTYPSDDSWKNMEYILSQHPLVCSLLYLLIVGEQCSVY